MKLRKRVSDLSGFTEWVEQVLECLTDESGYGAPWFRGAGDSEYKLVPGLYRTKYGREEGADDELRSEFSRRALPVAGPRAPRDQWEWYFLMQHYRAPTRLLDWTDAALVALYFALTSWKPGAARKGPQSKPAVWALDPFALNSNFDHYGPVNTDFDGVSDYLPVPYQPSELPKYPIAVDPAFVDQRMLVQHSHFTIHGSEVRGIDEMVDDLSLKKGLFKLVIDVDSDSADYLLLHLATLGITQTTIFPDLEGLAQELRIAYGMDKKGV